MHLHALLPSSESMLAAQAEHDDEPAGEKVLRAHLTHEAVGEVVEPSGQQLHSDTDVAPTTGRNLPAGQATQFDDVIRLSGIVGAAVVLRAAVEFGNDEELSGVVVGAGVMLDDVVANDIVLEVELDVAGAGVVVGAGVMLDDVVANDIVLEV